MMTAKSHHKRLVYFYLMVQNLHHINQRKEHRYTPSMRDDKDDEDDKYDSKVFSDGNAQNLRRIKQRKGLCFIQK